MRTINYLINAFGFAHFDELFNSSFGHLWNLKALTISISMGIIQFFCENYLGVNLVVISSFVGLNILEYITGIRASVKKGEKIESRKAGRMLLKVGVYIYIMHILNTFNRYIDFPVISGYELDPFKVFYFGFIGGVIYQLYKSLMENLDALGYKEASAVLKLLKRHFNKQSDKK